MKQKRSSVSQEAIESRAPSLFPEKGCAPLGTILDAGKCAELRQWINGKRPINTAIFYEDKEEFEAKGRWHNYAPGAKDHNLLMDEKPDLSFIEENPAFIKSMEALAGRHYTIMKKSIIRSTPGWAIPEWILDYVKDVGRPNLNPFIRDEFQDVQYFHATDFHQDKTRPESNFVTVYIYLDKVVADYSALRILEGSHRLGMTTYPHLLRKSPHQEKGKSYWFYSDNKGNHEKCYETIVTGEAGSIFSFHCFTLHGTVLNNSKDPRISLRYLIAPKSNDNGESHLLAQANRKVYGPHKFFPNRTDVGTDGRLLQTGSSLLSHE